MSQKRALLVEDHQDTLYAMRFFMEHLGYLVLDARSIKEAITHIESNEFDIIITDLLLNDGCGLDVMSAVRSRSSTAKGIALTGLSGPDIERQAKDAGFSLLITKPVDFSKLGEAIAEVGL